MVLFRFIRKIINVMKYIVLFFIIVIGFAYFAKIRIPLPNGYILEGKSHVCHLLSSLIEVLGKKGK